MLLSLNIHIAQGFAVSITNFSLLELTLSVSLEADVPVEESDLGALYSWLKSSWTLALEEK